MAEQADATDLKSVVSKDTYGFNSRPSQWCFIMKITKIYFHNNDEVKIKVKFNYKPCLRKVSTMQTCKTCIFWSKDITSRYTWKVPGGICINEKLTESNYENDSLVYTCEESTATEDYHCGSFWTGPEFGCVHHKEKEINKKTKICPDCGASYYHDGFCGLCKGEGYI